MYNWSVFFGGGDGPRLHHPQNKGRIPILAWNIYLKRKTLPPPLPLKSKKCKGPVCESKDKGTLFSPFRTFSTDKNGIDLNLHTCAATITLTSSRLHLCFFGVLSQEERLNFYWCFPCVSFLFNFLRVIFRVINYSSTLSCSPTTLCLEQRSSSRASNSFWSAFSSHHQLLMSWVALDKLSCPSGSLLSSFLNYGC